MVGAIELSRDITNRVTREKNLLSIDQNIFRNLVIPKFRIGVDEARFHLHDIITGDSAMERLKDEIRLSNQSQAPVMIFGETGTGKELFAHAIHNESSRKSGPFISQNCAAIPENLLESILFGAVKGSYTGANDSPGLFELAHGGTLFLDELNSMPIHLQSKLLRVLEDGFVRRLGDKSSKPINVRIITAMNQDPIKAIETGILRRDIYYRLCVIYFPIPPLRERKNDIVLLIQYFINKYNIEYHRNIRRFSKPLYKRLVEYHWPGNVRELEHVIQFGMTQTLSEEEALDIHHVESRLALLKSTFANKHETEEIQPMASAIQSLESELIQKSLKKTGDNISKAAELLKIPRQTLSRKINKYQLR